MHTHVFDLKIMAEYKGASSEGQRQAMLEKQRAKMLSDFEKQREKITKVGCLFVGDRFL